MVWKIIREDVQFFRDDLWKDLRRFPRRGIYANDYFVKDCFSESGANLEASVLRMLRDSAGEVLVPEVNNVSGPMLVMERVRGIRLFDLLRYLRTVELERRDGVAAAAWKILLRRSRERLRIIQLLLYEHKDSISAEPYPIIGKIGGLLRLLTRVLGIYDICDYEDELGEFASYWDSHCSCLPFRDATTKNTMVADGRLDLSASGSDAGRKIVINSLLGMGGGDFWNNVPLIDIDFSSVEHLTSPEDDPISLHCHEWTSGSCSIDAGSLNLMGEVFPPDNYRAAASLLVRYLRFGGRKLAYKLINAQGYEVRFRYDDPLFYFKNYREHATRLSAEFVRNHKSLIDVVETIGHVAARPSPADEGILRVDHFRRYFGEGADYWQENPNEQECDD